MNVSVKCHEVGTGEDVGRAPRSGDPLPHAEARLVQAVARSFRVRSASLFAAGRTSARESLARHAAMYLLHVTLGRSYAEVGARFRRHRTSVIHACARIEDRRDDRAFDARMVRLESALTGTEETP